MTPVHPSPLDRPPSLEPITARQLGRTLVVAPHPDDESLGCGGAIAMLNDLAISVAVVVVTDGAASHPGSRKFPPPALRDLRRAEAFRALGRLGTGPEGVTFLELPDGALPGPGDPDFCRASSLIAHAIRRDRPETILAPWRREPHADHRATWVLVRRALESADLSPRLLEYPIWALGHPPARPRHGEARAFRLDIGPALRRKRAAIAEHQSQTTRLIDDVPPGCVVPAWFLADFVRPFEIFLEAP